MDYIYELIVIAILSFIVSAIICTICETQFNKFLNEINMSKYYTKDKLLLIQREFETEDNKLYDKYKSRMLYYVTLLIFIIVLLLDINYNIIKF